MIRLYMVALLGMLAANAVAEPFSLAQKAALFEYDMQKRFMLSTDRPCASSRGPRRPATS